MPLWKATDTAANSDIAALMQMNKSITTANQSTLYGNVTPNVFFSGVAVGQFAVDVNEVAANKSIPHSGWNLRKEGTGGRAGRVTYETLVAMGSMGGDGSDDTYLPDYKLTITTQPVSNTGSGNVTLRVAVTSVPSGATITYKWQQSYAGALSWTDIPNTAGVWFSNTSPILTANAAVANANTVRVVASVVGGNTVYSSNATITKV